MPKKTVKPSLAKTADNDHVCPDCGGIREGGDDKPLTVGMVRKYLSDHKIHDDVPFCAALFVKTEMQCCNLFLPAIVWRDKKTLLPSGPKEKNSEMCLAVGTF
jgi:hypothetical protein